MMTSQYEDFQGHQEDAALFSSPTAWTQQGVVKKWMPRPSSGLICFLSALCTGLLFITIILVVTVTRQGVSQTEQNLEVKLRNLSMGVSSRVERLSQDDSRMMDKLVALETLLKNSALEDMMSKVTKIESSVKRILSEEVLGSYASDLQRILGAVGDMAEVIRDINNTTGKTWDPLCEKGWKHFALNCYLLSSQYLSWSQSKTACETKGAILVVVNNEEEKMFLRDYADGRTFWIGLTDVDGAWKWVDGTSYDLTPKFWMPGQPDEWFGHGLGGGEDCAQMKFGNDWNDDHCSKSFRYMCEKKSKTSR
ncbi:asialoglycoprotein receptor 1-like [Hyperolius riggenbachi]|uniref:asialoglycoprotein receptor 1-like n=1 Tax=Hyperolius riggenbachi TaxID=752182 RepID=UPI0035A37D8C